MTLLRSIKLNLSLTNLLINNPVDITAKATGGTKLQYEFEIYNETTLIKTQEYSSSNTLKWTPIETGPYYIKIFVKNENSSNNSDAALKKPIKSINLSKGRLMLSLSS